MLINKHSALTIRSCGTRKNRAPHSGALASQRNELIMKSIIILLILVVCLPCYAALVEKETSKDGTTIKEKISYNISIQKDQKVIGYAVSIFGCIVMLFSFMSVNKKGKVNSASLNYSSDDKKKNFSTTFSFETTGIILGFILVISGIAFTKIQFSLGAIF